MTRYHGHQNVEPGIYFNFRHLQFRSLDEQGRLPGDERQIWRRVPVLAMLIAGPLAGAVYAIFLPLIGFLMLAGIVLRAAARLAGELAGAASRVLRPAWQPANAFLGRSKTGTEERAEDAEADGWEEKADRELDDEGEA